MGMTLGTCHLGGLLISRVFVLLVCVAMVASCSSKETADTCAEIQRACIDSGK